MSDPRGVTTPMSMLNHTSTRISSICALSWCGSESRMTRVAGENLVSKNVPAATVTPFISVIKNMVPDYSLAPCPSVMTGPGVGAEKLKTDLR